MARPTGPAPTTTWRSDMVPPGVRNESTALCFIQPGTTRRRKQEHCSRYVPRCASCPACPAPRTAPSRPARSSTAPAPSSPRSARPRCRCAQIARDVGMVSSAVYRYFPSRDDLLTALIVEAYDELGDAVERPRPPYAGARPRPAVPRRVPRDPRLGARATRTSTRCSTAPRCPGYAAPDTPSPRPARVTGAFLRLAQESAGRRRPARPRPRR